MMQSVEDEVTEEVIEEVRAGYGDGYPELDAYTAEALETIIAHGSEVLFSTARLAMDWSRDKMDGHMTKKSPNRTGLQLTPYVTTTKKERPNGTEERIYHPEPEGQAALQIWKGRNREEIKPADERPARLTVADRREIESTGERAHDRIDHTQDDVADVRAHAEKIEGWFGIMWHRVLALRLLAMAREEYDIATMYAEQVSESSMTEEEAVAALRQDLEYQRGAEEQ